MLAFHVGGMIEDGEPLPHLRSLAELRTDPDVQEAMQEDAVVILVPIDLPASPVRINISIDANLLRRIDRAAKSRGETRSGFLATAAKSRLAS